MKSFTLFLILLVFTIENEENLKIVEDVPSEKEKIYGYDPSAAINYAYNYARGVNHQCGSGAWACTPYGYFGDEHCGYPGEGGDCANFVSQCLIAGGHPKLAGHPEYCRNFCGAEIGATELGRCLSQIFGHQRDCGLHMPPPSWIQPGDVLIYHPDNCDSYHAHAVFITKVEGGVPKITCHSNIQVDRDYNYLADSKPYYEWIHIS